MKIWMWVSIGVLVVVIIVWAMYAAQQRKLAAIEAELMAVQQPEVTDQRTNIWDIIGGIIGGLGIGGGGSENNNA